MAPRWVHSLIVGALLASLAWPVASGGEAAASGPPAEAPSAADPVVAEAKSFYDGLADETKRKVYRRFASTYDPAFAGALLKAMDPPRRFGVLRFYPRAYDLARRVAALPLDQQQLIYGYVYAHQVRSGWVSPAKSPAGSP